MQTGDLVRPAAREEAARLSEAIFIPRALSHVLELTYQAVQAQIKEDGFYPSFPTTWAASRTRQRLRCAPRWASSQACSIAS